MPSIYLILGLSFILVLLVTYSTLVVSSKQMERARKYHRMQTKFRRNDLLIQNALGKYHIM